MKKKIAILGMAVLMVASASAFAASDGNTAPMTTQNGTSYYCHDNGHGGYCHSDNHNNHCYDYTRSNA